MTSTFTVQRLTGSRAVVSGTDTAGNTGTTIVSTEEWDRITRHLGTTEAQQEFDSAVEDFFKPLTDAAAQLQVSFSNPASDPVGYVVLREEVPATAGQQGEVVKLSRDSVILRMIEGDDTNRLVWVGDELEILEKLAPASTVGTVDVAEVLGQIQGD